MATPNSDQIAHWNGARGESWVREQEARDRSLAPFGEAAIARARPAAGERVLDIGCGCGASTLAIAAAVGPGGAVLGVDVSTPMLARARERAAGFPAIQFARADASTYAFDGSFDLAFSRFGVMFFDNPRAAFANLRRALRLTGRMAFVCWRSLEENHWMAVPFQAVREAFPSLPVPVWRGVPGPLAFADPDDVRRILSDAGFAAVQIEPFDHPMPLGDGGGLEAAAADAVTIGPTARLLADADEATLDRARQAVQRALRPHLKGTDVSLPGAAWVVSARASPGRG